MTKVSNQAQLICLREGHIIHFLPSPETSRHLLHVSKSSLGWNQSAKRVQEFGFGSETGSLFLGRVKTRYSSRSTLLE